MLFFMSISAGLCARYVSILVAIVVVVEYSIMSLFYLTGFDGRLSHEAEACTDALLLVLLSAAPVYFWILRPISRLIKTHQDTLENLAEALEGAGDAVMITDTAGDIQYVNKAFTAITGYRQLDVLGKNPRILQSGKQSRAFYTMMWRSLQETKEWKGEIWNKRRNGELYPEALHIKAVTAESGTIKAFVAVFSDTTSQQHQEKVLRQSQKMDAVRTLVGGIAHNFNNMLAGISGTAFLAKRCSKDPKVNHYLQGIESITHDAALIVRQLLSFSHESVLEKKNAPIGRLLEAAIVAAQSEVAEKNIEFIAHISTEPLAVYCAPEEMQQALLNLIHNACDAVQASRQRRVSISLESRARDDGDSNSANLVCSPRVARVTIEDTGPGIDDGDIEHIFDPFFTTKQSGMGTGLGLSMCKGTIESHGGTIHVNSEPGQGSRFVIDLPLTDTPTYLPNEHPKPVGLAKRRETILVVDDDRLLRNTICQILEEFHYRVLTAPDGQAGLDLFNNHHDDINLVISDVVMPVMDGNSAVQQMRCIKPTLPVIFITGYDHQTLVRDNEADNHTMILLKPFDIMVLNQQVEQLLNMQAPINT